MKKRTKILATTILSLTIVGVVYWEYRVEIADYFLLKHSIVWSKNVKIKYEDFQKAPDSDSEFDIHYYHGFFLYSSPIEKAYVKAFFDKNKSWVKDTTKFNFQELLVMEKIEFDLAECYARKFNREIDKIKGNENVSFNDLEKIGDKIYLEYDAARNQFYNDKERNVTQLIEFWKPKIDKLLKESEK